MVRAHLEALLANTDTQARIAFDPVAFPHRYEHPDDVELAAIIAAQLAYGRVSLFRPRIAQLLERADEFGGPRKYIENLDLGRERAALDGFVYRLQRGEHIALFLAGLQGVLVDHGQIGTVFNASDDEEDSGPALIRGITVLREATVRAAQVDGFAMLPRGVKFLLSHPGGGSATKRWNMLARWMVRPADGVDLGLWKGIVPRQLVIPVDTHVASISRLLGLTTRKDNSWRTAIDITRSLRVFDPLDPIRYDFALAHLGISGACKGGWEPTICPDCPLRPVCVAAQLR